MDLANIRLELVRLVHRHDKPVSETAARARELERYITGADMVNPRANKGPKAPASREPQQAG